MTDFLYEQPQLLIVAILLLLLGLAGELGYRAARRVESEHAEAAREQVGLLQGALLGLFALLLGFTFAMALARFDARKQMVVREANAIGTAALRSDLLPEPLRGEAIGLFRRYVQVRLEARQSDLAYARNAELDAQASQIQEQLWKMATAAARAQPRSAAPVVTFITAMNELIDVKGERDAALANRVPESVLFLLCGFAATAIGIVGYRNGLAGTRLPAATLLFSGLIALVILVIIDLDRPLRGMIRVSQQSMLELQRSLERD